MAPRLAPGHEYILTLSCPDAPGLVYAVSSFLVQQAANIRESQQFDDALTGRFFMRVRFSLDGSDVSRVREAFGRVAAAFQMSWQVHDAATPTRTLLLVSRFGHCLNDLLFRASIGALNVEIPAVVSNHRDFEGLAAAHGVPFHYLPVTPETKVEAEARLLELVDQLDVDLVVLARYMQVLSDALCSRLAGRAINIHHSFLPSFKGAKPYHQAHDRGVKLIGATAHYVTTNLDEGPIIEQEVARVDHGDGVEQLATIGGDVECLALARAVRWHLEHRVLLDGHKTIVFR
jgi:formyltetrahydrofolate deformylase